MPAAPSNSIKNDIPGVQNLPPSRYRSWFIDTYLPYGIEVSEGPHIQGVTAKNGAEYGLTQFGHGRYARNT